MAEQSCEHARRQLRSTDISSGELDLMRTSAPVPEDTQPPARRPRATLPQAPASGRRARMRPGGCILLALIILLSCSLVLTTSLFVRSLLTSAGIGAAGKTVQVQIGGTLRKLETSAETVGAALEEQGIELPAAAILSPATSAPLADGMLISVRLPREVTLAEEGRARIFETALESPLAILESAGVAVGSADRIWINGAPARFEALADWPIPVRHIRLRRPAQLTIIEDGISRTVLSSSDSVAEALFAAGVALQSGDKVSPPLESPLSGAMTVRIERALPVELLVDGVVIEARTGAATVADALAELNAPLFGLDYVLPSADAALSAGMTIEIIRVTEELHSETETIPYERRIQADAQMELDQRALIQPGRDGRREIRYHVRYENGAEISRVHAETIELEAPIAEILAYGTGIVTRSVQTAQGPLEYWRVLCMLATSYKPESQGGSTATAIGETLRKGIVASDPDLIRYRTRVYVPGYGVGLMADTAGYRSSPYWIDLGYSDQDWITWRSYVKVYLLTPAPAEIDYLLPAWTPNRSYPGNCN